MPKRSGLKIATTLLRSWFNAGVIREVVGWACSALILSAFGWAWWFALLAGMLAIAFLVSYIAVVVALRVNEAKQ